MPALVTVVIAMIHKIHHVHAGAIIRLLHDGSIPADNQKQAGWAPELFSKGHRNPQGLAINPETGVIWAHEHGPRGGDEINIIQAGQNYGWPKVSHGEEYGGGSIGSGTKAPGLADPVWVWTPSIAPSGMAFLSRCHVSQFERASTCWLAEIQTALSGVVGKGAAGSRRNHA